MNGDLMVDLIADNMELPGQIETQANTDTSDDESYRATAPEVPIIHKPSMPSAPPDNFKRQVSVDSKYSSRNIHEHVDPGSKNSAHEMQRTLESLHSFRIALETNQLQCLRLFDHELEKLKRNLPADATARMSYKDRLLKPGGDRLRRSARSKSSAHSEPANRHSAASKCSKETEKSTHEGTQSLTQRLQSSIFSTNLTSSQPTSPQSPQPPTSPASPGMSLPKRQRRMSWITKQGTGFLDAKALEELKTQDAGSESQEEVQRKKTARTTYSSEASVCSEKRGSKTKSEELKTGGMFTQLNPDLAKDAVRDRAAAEFGKPRLEIMKTEGRLYAIATHPFFERITLAVILLNAGWIGVDIELNKADMLFNADPVFIVMENFFCIFFLAELIVRFGLFKKTSYVIKDIWFLADFFLVSLMILETWVVPVIDAFTNGSGSGMSSGASVLRVARVMRVLRTARMARLVRLMPELMILIKGMMVAFRSVFFTLLLLLLITYVFAVAFVQFARDTNLERGTFGTMGEAVTTLILKCILTDQEDLIRSVTEESFLMSFLLLTFIFFGSLTVMNMLLGVLVEAIKTVSTIEREQLEVDFAKRVLWDLISRGEADTDGDNCISEEEYMAVLQKPEAMTALTSLGVDVDAALDYGKLLFEDGEPLTFGDFMKGILTLRGSNQTTVKDIVDLRKFTADEFSHLQEVLEVVNQQLALNRPHDAGAEHSRRASFSSSRADSD